MTEPFKNEQTAQSILHEWHSDLEVYAQTFYEQVEMMTEWDKVIFSNNETIYGLQQQIAVLQRLHEDTRHRLGRLDRDQQDLEALVRWCEEGLDRQQGGDMSAGMASSPADHTLRLAIECKDEYEAINSRVEGMVKEIRAARDIHGDVGSTMAQVETKLSTGFDLLQLVDSNAEDLSHNLSVVEAQLEHRYRALGGTPQYPGAMGGGR